MAPGIGLEGAAQVGHAEHGDVELVERPDAIGRGSGDEVAVLRKGRIFAQCVSGTTIGQRGAPANFNHSSTLVARAGGLVTSAAASATVGSEVSAWPNGALTWFRDVGLSAATNPLAVVEINAP